MPPPSATVLIPARRKRIVNEFRLSKPAVSLRLLGRYELSVDRRLLAPPRTAKARSLLAYLALRAGEPIRRETLMDVFWPDADPASARNNLKTALSSIRRTFRDQDVEPEAVFDVSREIVRWTAPTAIDAREVQACSVDVEAERADAIALYGGEFAPGDANEWASEQRGALVTHFEHVLRAEIAAHPTRAVAEKLLALDPFSDAAYLAMIDEALHAGNRRGAQAIYRRYATALAEIDVQPPPDVTARVGLGAAVPAASQSLGFVGRADELAEIERLFLGGASMVVVNGSSGIGKSMLAQEARRRFDDLELDVLDTHDVLEPSSARTIVCAHPELLGAVRSRFPGAEEIELGPLAYDEVAVALRHLHDRTPAAAVDAVWRRSLGHPAVLQGIVAQIDRLDAVDAKAIARLRLPGSVERRFDELIRSSGSDATELAMLLALEPRLDDDDIAALLDWTLARVLEARESCARLGAALPHASEAALRTISKNRRAHLLGRIAERLKLHEDPAERVDAANLLVELGRRAEASRAYLDAAQAFTSTSAWESATRSIDAGLAALESLPQSEEIRRLSGELHLLKGKCLYQQGAFLASTRANEEALEVCAEPQYSEMRIAALVSMGHALVRMDLVDSAWEIAKQARDEATRYGTERDHVAADHLLACVLRDRYDYDAAAEAAASAFDRSMRLREWSTATNSANLVIEISRRALRIDAAFAWAPRQLEAAALAGPVQEAVARHMLGSVRASVGDLDGALEEFRHGLALIEMHRRRRSVFTTPSGQLEWMLHYAIAHTYVRAGNAEQAVAESEWLIRSPWMLNSPMGSWQGLSVAVDARLASGSPRDLAAAKALVERIPPRHTQDPRSALDPLARARVAARLGRAEAPQLLRAALAALVEVAEYQPDQIHPYFFRLAESAKGIDDLIGARATELAQRYERRLAEAAADLWVR